jgi:hypothetical protein
VRAGSAPTRITPRPVGPRPPLPPFVSFVSLCYLLTVALSPSFAEDPPKPKPEWKTTRPLAVTRGTTSVLRITGQDLQPKEVRFEQPGLAAKILKTEPLAGKTDEEKAQGNSVVEVELTVPAAQAPGSYEFKLVHEGADSPIGRIYIDEPMPEIEEKEPNDTLRQPQALPAGPVAILGRLDKDGVDVYQIQGKAGETWRFDVIARRAGADFDPVLRLRDPRLTPIRAAIDQGEDCFMDVKLPTDGPYLLELFDGDNRSNAAYFYRLRVVAPRRAP